MKKLCVFIICFLLLKFSLFLCSLRETTCFWRMKQSEEDEGELRTDCGFILFINPYPIEEDFYNTLIHFRIPTRKYEYFLVLLFATDEINRNPFILPNMSIIFSIISGMCFQTLDTIDLRYSPKYSFFRPPNYDCRKSPCNVALTGPSWTTSVRLTTYTTYPQIFFGPFHPILSDNVLFPYVYQVAHKDACLPRAMVSLMLYFAWIWIGLVISDDDQGIQFLSDLREEMQRKGICLAFVNMIPDSIQLYTKRAVIYDNQIMTSSAKVVAIYGEMNSTLEVSFRRWAYLGVQRIWVTTSQWDVITSNKDFSLDPFHGTITYMHHHGKVSKFMNFMRTLNTSKYPVDISQMKMKWNFFNCSVSDTNYSSMNHYLYNTTLEWLSQHKFDMVWSEEGYNLYNAVYAVAHTYHEIILQQLESQNIAKPTGVFRDCHQMASLLKYRVFTNPVGELVDMNLRKKLCANYDIYNIWNFPQGFGLKVKIGSYSSYLPQSQQLHISEDLELSMGSILVPTSTCSVTCTPGFRKFYQEQAPDCCFDCAWCPENEISNETADMEQCVRCPDDQYSSAEHTHCLQRHVSFLAYEDPLGMTLAFMSLCFSALTALVLGAFVKYNGTPIVKANNRTLSYILLVSITFCFLCALFFIGHPNTVTCILQQTTFGVFFTVAVSTVLAKTITVVLAFKLTTPGRRMRRMLLSGVPNFVIPICTLFQSVVCGIWLVTSPPFIDTDTSEHGQIIIVCNKGSVIAFHFVLGYLGSLALGSFTVAFLARNLPDRFNEAKFLTFSMLVFCCVWVTFLPVYHSTKGKVMVAVEVFSILASCAGLLGCIFVPKCYVILIRPYSNSLQKYKDKLLY
ncbi:vomeronasal type-2 receptor 116 isoform X2 [Cricetulus griseus]|uniref:Vomeronasal type-2 receptor 116 isoform X2 n=1 Tax=Cricetulus griseus TaxID=10029 RepID=A0A9J7G299_CRIGR|nr:vomeronasal type-2 receptor 116 isoform X2 [Cricetulus griseus]XP_027272765.1 vomeronasal type-2 receptor 116 isoform X2 [Cricetulus griseus]